MTYYPGIKFQRTPRVAAAVRERRRTMLALEIMQQQPPGHLNLNSRTSPSALPQQQTRQVDSGSSLLACSTPSFQQIRTHYSFNSHKSIRRGASSHHVILHFQKMVVVILIICLSIPISINTIVVAQEVPSASVSPSMSHSPALSSSLLSSSLPSIASLASGSGSPSLTTVTSSASNIPTRIPMPSDRNFCGTSLAEAGENCSADRHCPMGNNNECPPGLYCYTFTACNIVGMPTMEPTISPKPTLNPASTIPPTTGPIAKDDIRNFFYCGLDWGDASERCYKRCMSGLHTECPSGEECFSNAGCKELKEEDATDDEASEESVEGEVVVEGEGDAEEGEEDSEELGTNSTLSPDASPSPTIIQNVTYEPTAAPIAKDDIRNFFFCGKDWSDASDRCYLRCLSGFHSECPEGEECFAQADCRGVKETKSLAPTLPPSMAPFSGTRSPTLSPIPTISPSITMHPSVQVTLSPELVPSDPPTTRFPTEIPTLATCGGDPCSDPEQCRSIQNFCGVGETYCNEKSVWTASCGVPTDPPVTGSPTTIWPSLSPSISTAPTGVTTLIPTENFSELLDESSNSQTSAPSGIDSVMPDVSGESLMPSTSSTDTSQSPTSTTSSSPTVATSSSPTYTNVDDQTFAPDDPAGSFFCGLDWNQAITECPHRCPTGETTQCPEGMQCYAFTPCLAVGMNTPPSMKPTWEPTKHPISMTNNPTTTVQYWAAQNDANEEEAADETSAVLPTLAPVSAKPSNAPTQDKCRGFPCDYEGECRSSLGFCGTGVSYCNTVSSWVPECGGGKGMVHKPTTSPNVGSTASPAIAWEEWSQGNDGVDGNATETDSSSGNNTYDPAVWENWGAPDKSTQVKEEESYAWWTADSSTAPCHQSSFSMANHHPAFLFAFAFHFSH